MRKGSRSLRHALTRAMIWMQAVVLTALVLIATVPIINLIGSDQVLDDGVVPEIAKSIRRDADGQLEVMHSSFIGQVAEQFPLFWFYAADKDGNAAQSERTPPQIALMATDLSRINFANIADIGHPETPAAIIRQHESEAGRLWIITGGGPKFGPRQFVLAASNPFFIGLLSLLTITSLLVIPHIVRRQLRGLDGIAKVADTIDVDQRGIRLSTKGLPSELHPLVSAINKALHRLDQGAERQNRFMADAAHELRTPIAILQTRLELLPANEERHRLQLDVARLGGLANQLLDLQRMDLSPQPFERLDLVELASQVASDLAPLAIAAGDDISFETDTEEVYVLGDRGALTRAVTNLIQNAISHGGRGIDIIVSVNSNGSVRVTDTGTGIAPDELEEIFEPFHRVDPMQHGAGLGLNLVRDIVRRHNGRVSARSTAPGGAEFEIKLPLTTELPV